MPKKILVVDDNEASRSLLVFHTQRWGMEVTGCASGEEALERLGGEPARVHVVEIPDPAGLLPGPGLAVWHRRHYPLSVLHSARFSAADPLAYAPIYAIRRAGAAGFP